MDDVKHTTKCGKCGACMPFSITWLRDNPGSVCNAKVRTCGECGHQLDAWTDLAVSVEIIAEKLFQVEKELDKMKKQD